MNKKTVSGLLLIMVAAIIVATISGAYAYFQVLGNTSSQSTITAQMPNVGLVGVSGGATLNLNLTPDMLNNSTTSKGNYYAQTGDTAPNKTEKSHTIATFSLSKGDANLKYTCNGNVTISIPDTATIKSVLEAGSLFAKLTQGNGVTLTDSGENIDLSAAKSSNIVKPFTVVLTSTSSALTPSTNINAAVYFVNTNSSQNSYMGKSIQVNITTSLTDCSATTATV